MKLFPRIIAALGLLAFTPGLACAVEAYRDKDQNIYFDGLPPDRIVRVTYIPDPSRRDRRYKSAWMYKTTSQFTCTVHHLWNTRKFPLYAGPITIFGAAAGADLDINVSFPGLIGYTNTANPCSGATINNTLPWTNLGNGIKAIQTYDPCRFQYTYQGQPGCRGANVIYLAGLPNPAYRVATSGAETRMSKVNACGLLKLGNTTKWKAYPKDRFTLVADYSFDDYRYESFGTFNRGNLTYRDFSQIPKCLNGKRFMPAPTP